MKRDVLVSISGTQTELGHIEENENEAIEVVNPATYFFKDGLHYIFYEEVHEGTTGITKNKIVYKENESLEVIKKGVANSTMLFKCDEQHVTNYETPYGNMQLEIITHTLTSVLEEESLTIRALYELKLNCESYAESEIVMRIHEKAHGI